MNIVISLECSPEQCALALDGIYAALAAGGLDAVGGSFGALSTISCTPKSVETEVTQPELPPEPEANFELPPAPEISVSPTGIVAMVNVAPFEPIAEPEMQHEPEPAAAPAEPSIAPNIDNVRVLTLSTSFFIPGIVDATMNTSLRVLNLSVIEGIARFTFNGFEHALPVATDCDVSIANPSHVIAPTTVRLVIDIANRVYPCLVDLEQSLGEEEFELFVGGDLAPTIVETDENVSTE